MEPKPAAFDVKVVLRDIEPPVWRRLRVSASLTLRELHHVLQIAFGWNDSHLHEFAIGQRRFGMVLPDDHFGEPPLDERDHPLRRLLKPGDRFEYEYDFGDGWQHEISVEATAPAGPLKAECLDGARSAPPDDCGGPGGYQELVEALAHPKRKRSLELLEWAGPDFAPERFELAVINRELKGAGTAAFRRKRERFYEGA